jgi:hypothetical protein
MVRDTLISGANNVGISDTRAQIVDGIMFKIDTIAKFSYGVIKDPSPTSQSKNFGWTYTGNRNLAGVDTNSFVNYLNGNYRPMQSMSMGLSWVNSQYASANQSFRAGFSSAIDTAL